MRVSGDVEALKLYLQEGSASGAQGNSALAYEALAYVWSYQDDIGLSMPDNSVEYRELLFRKGRHEIEKRKNFLLSAGVGYSTAT